MRKLLLFIVTAGVTMAFAAPAMASEGVQVNVETGGQACTTATCNGHFVNSGLIELTGHIFGFPVHMMDCNLEYTMNVASNGSGTFSNVSFSPGDLRCLDLVPCNGAPWAFTGEELAAANTSELAVHACLDGTSAGRCQGAVDIRQAEMAQNHRYQHSAIDQRFGSSQCEITGTMQQEADRGGVDNTRFEIVHQ